MSPESAIKFLVEAARYFEKHDTAGEDHCDLAVAAFLQDAWCICEWPANEVDDPTHWMPLPTPPSSKGTNNGR